MQDISDKKMWVEEPIRVITYDTDYMGIVSNTVYIKWFEALRLSILDKYYPLQDMLKDHKTPIISEINIKYKRPVDLNCKPIGRAWMDELSKSKWVIKTIIYEGDTVYCEGMQCGYYYDLDKKRPCRFPDEFVDKFNEG